MDRLHPHLCAIVLLTSLTALAQRPPARGHAAQGVEGRTSGERFLATLPRATRQTLEKEGQALLAHRAGGDGMVRAVLRLDRPRDEVYALISQPSKQAHYLPHITQSKTVERTAEGESTDMVVEYFVTFRYRTQHWFYPEEYRVEWNLDPTGDGGLAEQLGFFQLYELDEKTTIAEYGTRVVAKAGLIDFLRGLGERGAVPEVLTRIRSHVATGK